MIVSLHNRVMIYRGEGSPSYLFHPYVPQRVKDCLGIHKVIRFIILLRNPVDRLLSAFRGNVMWRGRSPSDFEEDVEYSYHYGGGIPRCYTPSASSMSAWECYLTLIHNISSLISNTDLLDSRLGLFQRGM